MNSNTPIYKTSVISLLVSIFACVIFLKKGDATKDSFQKIEGKIISLVSKNENYFGKDSSKFRYLQIDNYEKPFQLFIGKSSGDFKPKLEYIDRLQTGDSITIFFEETFKTQKAPVNNLVKFIDRGPDAIFIEGNSKKNLLYGLIGFCIILIPILFMLKKKGEIF